MRPLTTLLITFFLEQLPIVSVNGEFVVNAKTGAGNVIKLTIKENVQESFVVLEYEDWDLTKVTQIVDSKSGFNIYKVVLLGEIDAGQPPKQSLCFINHLAKDEFIEPDSVSKLRQKNQDAIRSSENNLGILMSNIDLSINLQESDTISPHIYTLCHDSNGAVYSTEYDFAKTAEVYGRSLLTMKTATQPLSTYQLSRCYLAPPHQACTCRYKFSIDWYPCSLRYCKGADTDNSKPSYYKCGIKTCSLTRLYEFAVNSNSKCWWEWFTQFD